uniref:Ricin B lectin domain-containing protein n=1 Tax=Alexandrium catenella TaxID=2925 RepID=A0A7S1RJV6_ALECA|mmetsp:Transcript_60725/g.162542  ORF Transcript_60725/g.162542 Transcript_60725/m.162542 type:complete len:347 (+) Transcript_60725:71-1111(+)
MESWNANDFADEAEEDLLDVDAMDYCERAGVRSLAIEGVEQSDQHSKVLRPALTVVTLLTTAILVGVAVGRPMLPGRSYEMSASRAEDTVSFMLKGWEPAYIAWAQHPDKCWDVVRPHGTQNGMKLQMWDCANVKDKFMVPAGGFGPIKLASDPEYCLDAPGKTNLLQFWKCSEAPRENILFTVPKASQGLIHPANHSGKCLDVPDGDTSNGRRVQQWNCSSEGDRSRDMQFVIHWPVTCEWGPWSEWSNCSSACTTKRTRKQQVEHEDQDRHGECDGVVSQVNSCKPEDCTKTDTIELDSSGEIVDVDRKGKNGGSAARPAMFMLFCLLCLSGMHGRVGAGTQDC